VCTAVDEWGGKDDWVGDGDVLVFVGGDDLENDLGLDSSVNECISLMVNYIFKYQISFL